MRVTLLLFVFGIFIVGCPTPHPHNVAVVDAGVAPFAGPPDHTECGCVDGTSFNLCSDDVVCQQSASADCDNLCAAHGGLSVQECTVNDVGCLLGSTSAGDNRVICPCADGDSGACTSLSCDADAQLINEVCARACPGITEAPICGASTSCAKGGAPEGRDRLTCTCHDGSKASACDVEVCAKPLELERECTSLCHDHGGFEQNNLECNVVDADCALGNSGANGVVCHCNTAQDVGGCTPFDCASDAAQIKQACDDACARLSNPRGASSPVCAPDASCAAGGPALGPDQAFCHCKDDAVFTSCTAGCLDCSGSCASHGGLSNSLVDGCSQDELFCVLGGNGGASAITCTCQGFGQPLVSTRCGPIACDDAAALTKACDDECALFQGQSASPACVADDQGCAGGPTPYGPFSSDCGCGDGTHVATCVADCNDTVHTNLQCFPACHDHGGFQTYDCSSNATSCPP